MRKGPTAAVAAVSVMLWAALFVPPLLAGGEGAAVKRSLPSPPEDPEAVQADAEIPPEETEPPTEDPPEEEEDPPFPGERDGAVPLRVLDGGRVAEMDLGTYLAGVLRGEMPASFEMEALKAQAVAARTYTRRMIRSSKHGDRADICTDPGCCQAWRSEEAFREGSGSLGDAYEAKIEAAVARTDGETVLYEGQPILAVFHSSSPGLTQEVGKVWGGDAPYLMPVTSPERGESVPNYYSRVFFTGTKLRDKLLRSVPGAELSGPASQWLTDAERDAAGTIEEVSVGGVRIRGAKLRGILGLRSACFTWETEGDGLAFYVTGFGHGVGMSQYGAEQMAKDGASYREILSHYYTGVEIGWWEG